jgi:cytochrome c-type biogenesis protein
VALRLVVAFAAGLASVVTPCVLPLVPGYLSAVSTVEADRLGQRGVARRVAVSSLPFFAGFTVVFVVLGVGAAALAGTVSRQSQQEIGGFVLVVVGLAFVGALPWPERIVGTGLLAGARSRGSSMLLGGAFALCFTPCVTPVLATLLVLSAGVGSTAKAAGLLAAYAAGLALPFLLAAVALGRTMSIFRWLRDRYDVVRLASGVILVTAGLLVFFDRTFILNGWVNHVTESL